MERYIVSIVIPTKNRQKYCIAAIKQILSLGMKGVEICVQDNSDYNHLQADIDELNCNSIRYYYHSGVLSFVDNFSQAISLCKGEYVCMIGDDDGILPNIIDVAKDAEENSIDAVIPGLNSVYFWPTEHPIIKGGENGYLSLSYIKKGYKEVDTKIALEKLLKNGGLNYTSFDLPRVYHGLVKRNKFDDIIKKTGKCFDGLTPDIYMAVALSFVCNRTIRFNFPITISGICPTSGSSDSATGKHTGLLRDAPHFKGHDSYNWDVRIPAFYSVETIWAETLLHAIHNFDSDYLIDKFRFDLLEKQCLKKYPQFKDQILLHAMTHNLKLSTMRYGHLLQKYNNFIKRVIRRLLHRKGLLLRYYDVQDIVKAAEITVNEMNKVMNK